VPLDRALEQMASWVRQHGARESGAFDDIEIARGLPPSWVT
jgi:hypothetical protein